MICRFCKKDDPGLVKYGVRHYAHGRCWLDDVVSPQLRCLVGVTEALDTLAIGQLINFRPMMDFDSEEQRGTYAAVGMTTSEFMDYYCARSRREESR